MRLGIGLRLRASKAAAYFARFFTSASEIVGDYLTSSTSDLKLQFKGRGCFKGNGVAWLELDEDIQLGAEWIIEFSIDPSTSTEYIIGNDNVPTKFGVRYNGSTILVLNDFALYPTFTVSYTVNDVIKIQQTATEVKLFKNDIEIIGTNQDGLVQSNAYVRFIGRRYVTDFNITTRLNCVKVQGITSHYFPLDDFNPDATQTSAIFRDVEGGRILTAMSATFPDNISERDYISYNTLYGYATIDADNAKYPRLADDSGYAGLTGLEEGFKEYPAVNQGKGANGGNTYIFEQNAELIAKDVDQVFSDGVNTKEFQPLDIVDNDYVSITKTDVAVTDMKIL